VTDSAAYKLGLKLGAAVKEGIEKHNIDPEAMADLLRDLARKVTEQAARDDQQRKPK
jgi:hypothetical protein